MSDSVAIRPMVSADVEAVSRMIERTVRVTNGPDYPPDLIAHMVAKNTPAKVEARLTESQAVVATLAGEIVGTARLGPERINRVFVAPDRQGHGIGAALVGAVEALALEAGRPVVSLNSTLTAERFYRGLGYVGHVDAELARRLGIVPMKKPLRPNRAAARPFTIRTMLPVDAGATSRMVVRAIRETNAKDYPPASIAEMVAAFSPEKLLGFLAERDVVVACEADEIVGTAALGPQRINSVFVSPDRHGIGIGAALMAVVEVLARAGGREIAELNASFTAASFYERLGYQARHDPEAARRHGVVPMSKRLQG